MSTLIKGKVYKLTTTYKVSYIIEYLDSTIEGIKCSSYRFENDYIHGIGMFLYREIVDISETDEKLNPNVVILSELKFGEHFKCNNAVYMVLKRKDSFTYHVLNLKTYETFDFVNCYVERIKNEN